MAHTIIIRAKARADIRSKVIWLTLQRSAASAGHWHSRLRAAVRSLANNPNRCLPADEAADLGIELRELLHGRRPHIYRILFTIDGQTVNILRVRHAAQDRLSAGDV